MMRAGILRRYWFSARLLGSAAMVVLHAGAGETPSDEQSPSDQPAEDEASVSAEVRAASLIERGVERRRAGLEREALRLFQRAHQIHPSNRSLAQMGLAEKSIRNYVDAERHLRKALASSEDEWITEHRPTLEMALQIVQKQLAWLVVQASVRGAEVTVNGASIGTTPLEAPYRVVAGVVVVEVDAPGYRAWRASQTLPAGNRTVVTANLERLSMTPPPPVTAPASTSETGRGARDAPPDQRQRWTPWILSTAAVSAAGIGVGVGLGVRTVRLKNRRDSICPEPACADARGVQLDGQARKAARGSTAGFAVGAAAGVGALVLWIAEPDAAASSASASASRRGGFVSYELPF